MSIQNILAGYRTQTIARDVALRLALVMIVIILMLGTLYYLVSVSQAEMDLQRRAQDLANSLAEVLGVPLWNLDSNALDQVAAAYLQAENVVGLQVFNENNNPVVSLPPAEPDVFIASRAIEFQGRTIGVLELALSRQGIRALRLSILVTTLIAILVVSVAVVFATGILLQQYLNRPLLRLTDGIRIIAEGEYAHYIQPAPQADINAIIEQVNVMAAQIGERDRNLERQVADRTAALRRSSLQLQVAFEVARAVASILDVEQLIHEVTELIYTRFGFFHVGLFLLDETGRWAEYVAGTGDQGVVYSQEHFRLEVGGRSMVGWCTANARPRIAQDVTADAIRYSDERFAEAQAEAVFPLVARGQVLGALDVQSVELNAFDADILAALELMAGQIAVALTNARLFAQSQEALVAERLARGEMLGESWKDLLLGRAEIGYLRDEIGKVLPASGQWKPEMLQAMREGRVLRVADTLVVPIKSRERLLGALRLRKSAAGTHWSDDEVALTQSLAAQLEVALESARLYQDTQRRAVEERLVSRATGQMRESLDLETVLRTAAEALRESLSLARVEVRLASADTWAEPPES